MYQYPYGDTQQLNLDWLLEQWQETRDSIDNSLQAEIDRVEAAIADLLTARDQAVAAQTAAETASTAASGYASTASGAASTATAQATAAAASAALAGTHASNAQTSETNAGLQATAAGNSASAAAVSATNARNSELAAAASALSASNSSSAAAGNALYAEGFAVGEQNSTPVASGSPYYENNAKYYAEQAKIYGQQTLVTRTIENVPIATFENGANNAPVQALIVEVDPVQAGSGDPALDNVRAITGWTEANLYQSDADTSNPTTYIITFPVAAGTVYGGAIDLLSGKLVVDKGIISKEWSEFTNQQSLPTYKEGRIDLLDVDADRRMETICDKLAYNYSTNSAFYVATTKYVRASVPLTVADSEVFTFVYPLATPVEYILTPQQINTLLGTNNIWADTGNIKLITYYSNENIDIPEKLRLIKAMIATVESDYTATQAYSVNDFLIVDNTLYIVTANIANGATITPGTNVSATTIGTQITTILNS